MKEFPAVFVFPWSSGPLAREIPDIFRHGWRRAGKFRNDGGGGRCCVWTEGGLAALAVDHGRGCERIPLELRQRHLSRAVASRQRSRHSGGRPRLAAEIPDIFLPLARNDVRNDDGWGVVAVCSEGDCVSKRWTRERPHTAYRRWTGNTRGFDFFGLGDSFTQIGEMARGVGVYFLVWGIFSHAQERRHEGGGGACPPSPLISPDLTAIKGVLKALKTAFKRP